MKQKRSEVYKNTYKRVTALVLMINLIQQFISVWYGKLNLMRDNYFEGKGNLLMVLFYVALLFVLMQSIGGFKIGHNKALNVILSQTVAIFVGNAIITVQIVLMIGSLYRVKEIVWVMLGLSLTNILSCIIISFSLIFIYGKLFPPYNILIINGHYENELVPKIGTRRDKYRICEEISIDEDMDKIKEKALQYDGVILNDIPSKEKNDLLKYCFEQSIRVYFTPKLSDIIVKGTDEVDLFDSPLFLCKKFGLSMGQRFVKRTIDIAISLVFLIIALPIILVLGICIKSYDGGSIFFIQERCTRDGKKFRMYKLRSMIENAEAEGKSIPATDDDSRITPVGKFIRKTRLDELPQLINILKGDMSFVGPRPERVEHVEKYSLEVPEFAYRMKVKGGLTGYAQVYGKYNTSAYDKLKMDLMYIVNYSVLLDIQIVLMTIKVLFMKESTEGFKEKGEKENGK
ncbi:MAG: exopolysaccharide biosynthesis polyprenyl glycosylphosphotransferase [Lachnospiraceae bacterium]|nr:exopolysaccharide biosynthesis polyprenyl glycosylphosphotransferase [Lachnospiraceae bacterium]